jgi:hypothetical protein
MGNGAMLQKESLFHSLEAPDRMRTRGPAAGSGINFPA